MNTVSTNQQHSQDQKGFHRLWILLPTYFTSFNFSIKQICWLLNFICRYIPLKQWAFDDSHSPKYQKFKIDELPLITDFRQDWTYKDLIPYFQERYGKKIMPVRHRSVCDIPKHCCCPRCGAPASYLYKNNGSKEQLLCKVCDAKFSQQDNRFSKQHSLRCPHCGHSLVAKKTASTLYSINVLTPNALTTSISLKRWSSKIWAGTTAKTNISYTTSTASLR